MMQRFWTIMLAVVLYLAWGASDAALSFSSCNKPFSELSHNNDNQESAYTSHPSCATTNFAPTELFCSVIRPNGNNSFRLSVTSRSAVSFQNNISSRNNLRYRSLTERIMAEAIHSRIAGHITKIFEYNPYTSSLRVAYYLHTLCRLRI